ncbi:unnamed protein product [Rhizophagus irregularis]|nr:unnamed protein product [Rhizophagus irregularis]
MSQNDNFQPSPSESYELQQDNNNSYVQTDDSISQGNANQHQDTSQYALMQMGPQQTFPTNILMTDSFQLYDNHIYKITCEIIVPPSLINSYLYEHYYDTQIEQNMRQEQLNFAPSQRENLRYHLELYLRNKVLY